MPDPCIISNNMNSKRFCYTDYEEKELELEHKEVLEED